MRCTFGAIIMVILISFFNLYIPIHIIMIVLFVGAMSMVIMYTIINRVKDYGLEPFIKSLFKL